MRLALIVAIGLMLLASMARPHGRVVGDPLPGCYLNAHSPIIESPCGSWSAAGVNRCSCSLER